MPKMLIVSMGRKGGDENEQTNPTDEQQQNVFN